MYDSGKANAKSFDAELRRGRCRYRAQYTTTARLMPKKTPMYEARASARAAPAPAQQRETPKAPCVRRSSSGARSPAPTYACDQHDATSRCGSKIRHCADKGLAKNTHPLSRSRTRPSEREFGDTLRVTGGARAGLSPQQRLSGFCSRRQLTGLDTGGNWAGFSTRSWRPRSARKSLLEAIFRQVSSFAAEYGP